MPPAAMSSGSRMTAAIRPFPSSSAFSISRMHATPQPGRSFPTGHR